MTLRLPDPHVFDESTRRNFERVAQNFPLECSADNFRQVPQARAYHNVNQNIPDATSTALAFNSERWDLGTPSLNMHDTVTNNSRLTCRVPGIYSIVACVSFDANGVGLRDVAINLNGATTIADSNTLAVSGVISTNVSVPTQYRLAVGDYVEVVVYQNSGGGLNVNTFANYSPEFQMHWISP